MKVNKVRAVIILISGTLVIGYILKAFDVDGHFLMGFFVTLIGAVIVEMIWSHGYEQAQKEQREEEAKKNFLDFLSKKDE